MLTLAIQPWVVSVLVAVFLFACVVLILTVLIQRPQGGGLSGAFGAGGGAGQTAFGTKTGDALTIATITMFVVFLGLAIGLNFVTRPENIAARPAQAGSTGDETAEGTTQAVTEDELEDAAAAADEQPADTPAPTDDAATDPAQGAGDDAADAPEGDTTPPAETPTETPEDG